RGGILEAEISKELHFSIARSLLGQPDGFRISREFAVPHSPGSRDLPSPAGHHCIPDLFGSLTPGRAVRTKHEPLTDQVVRRAFDPVEVILPPCVSLGYREARVSRLFPLL